MVVNVINLKKRKDRMDAFIEQSKKHNFSFNRWEGEVDLAAVFRGISNSHKKIVSYAMQSGQEMVCIMEDDCEIFDGGWKYFLDNIPDKFSLYMGMIYEGEIDENNRIVKSPLSFSGLTCYIVHESFYLKFLNINPLSHLDRSLGALADKFEFYVCNPMICKQSNGWSDNKKQHCEYDHLLKGRKLFNQ